MYDYISIYSKGYSVRIKSEMVDEYLLSNLKFIKDSNLTYSKEINGETIRVVGILADSQGNYAYNSLKGIEEINLIEINLPENINEELEKTILSITKAIADEFSWLIDIRD